MDTTTQPPTSQPPRLIQCLTAGFNLVASKITLILIPVGLDLLLWFGPHFRIRQAAEPLLQEWYAGVQAAGTAEMVNMLGTVQQLWTIFLERFNLLSFLSTLPVGVPSLLTGISPVENPLGAPLVFEVGSFSQVVTGFLLFSLLGLVLGSLYFGAIARSTGEPARAFNFAQFTWETGQTFVLIITIIVLLLILAIPVSVVTFILTMVSPGLAQMALLLMSFIVLWLFLPLVFTPHGIFAAHQGVLGSILASARMVRLLFPAVGMFLLAALVLAQGMGYLWRIPPETSWLMVAGILGNAFISTGLLAASFVFYRRAANWVEELRRQMQTVRT